MKLRYVRAFIVLLAGLITLIVNMKTGRNVTWSLFIVLIVLLVFYVIGTLIVEIMQKELEEDKTQQMDSEIEQQDSNDTEDSSGTEDQDGMASFSFEEEVE